MELTQEQCDIINSSGNIRINAVAGSGKTTTVIHEIVELLNIKGSNEKHTEFIVANHINNFITYFCNSDKQKVQELNYLDIITDKKAKAFAEKFYSYIEKQSRLLLSKKG